MRRESMKPLAVCAAVVMGLLSSTSRPVEAQVLLAQGVRDLSEQIATKAKEQQKLRVAVLPFRELEGQPTVLGSFLAEELFTHLVNAGLEIVERSMLDKVLGEIKLDQTGVIDASTAKQVGKVVGVDAVVTGSITDLQSYVAINCRLIDVITGKIFAAAQAQIVKDDDVKKVLATRTAHPLGDRAEDSDESADGSTRPSAHLPQSTSRIELAQGFQFELDGCRFVGDAVVCEVLITNLEGDRDLLFLPRDSRLIDSSGNEALAEQLTVGARRFEAWIRGQVSLASGILTRVHLRFEGIKPSSNRASLVEVVSNLKGELIRVQFRNVPLSRRRSEVSFRTTTPSLKRPTPLVGRSSPSTAEISRWTWIA